MHEDKQSESARQAPAAESKRESSRPAPGRTTPLASTPAGSRGGGDARPQAVQRQAAAPVQLQSAGYWTNHPMADAALRGTEPPVQAKGGDDTQAVHEAAAAGIADSGSALPHGARIQSAFGDAFDLSGVQAHVGGPATDAAQAMGATAYATGDHVAFGAAPDLHTAAHEAAHVVQQRQGVQLHGGVGQSGDAYERHADQVADRVVAGESASELLAAGPSGGQAGAAVQGKAIGDAVQKDDTHLSTVTGSTDTGNQYTQELSVNKTTKRVQIQLGINWVKKGTWASDDAYNTFIRWVKTSVYGYIDNKFKIVCTPLQGGETIELPIDALLYDTGDGYKIEAHGGTPGGDSFMAQAGGEVYEYDSDDNKEEPITMAHEFGHCLLHASDEYANARLPDRVLTNDHSIMANYYAQGKDQAEFKVRHFQHICQEVAKLYPGYRLALAEM